MDTILIGLVALLVITGFVVLGLLIFRSIGQLAQDGLDLDAAVREESEKARREAADAARQAREELAGQLAAFRTELNAFRTELTASLSAFGEQQLARFNAAAQADLDRAKVARDDFAAFKESLSGDLRRQVADLSAQLTTALTELRKEVADRLTEIRTDNEKRLEQMRVTVDEKLQSTLSTRLTESFKLVSERLENVQKGLGQMQQLAGDVGNLQRVMSNVKTRGVWGEVLLGNLLEQILAPEQFDTNVAVTGTSERVEFAVKLPGRREDDAPVYLPIDAKFPREDYERLLAAQEAGDPVAAAAAGKDLGNAVRCFAEDIRRKYIAPPLTTDFAIMFLPSEGLYAEVLRRTDLIDHLQHKCKVLLTGPTTLAALLNSLQMGFRTLAIQKRSSEVWELLGAVKTEFGKYGELMNKLKKQLDTASNTIGDTEVRTRAIERKLRGVEAATPENATKLLGDLGES